MSDQKNEKFGFIVMSGNEVQFATLSGNTKKIIHKFCFELPKRPNLAGRYFIYHSIARIAECDIYLHKTVELAKRFFIDPHTSQPNVSGLILAASSDFRDELRKPNWFDPRLQAKILKVVKVPYGGENGFNLAVELSLERLSGVKFVQQNELMGKYFMEIARDSGKYVYGVDDTLKAAAMGAVESLIVWERLDITRYELKGFGSNLVKHVKKDEESEFELRLKGGIEVQDKISLVDWLAENYRKFSSSIEFVTNKSAEGSQFCKGFGGIGAILS